MRGANGVDDNGNFVIKPSFDWGTVPKNGFLLYRNDGNVYLKNLYAGENAKVLVQDFVALSLSRPFQGGKICGFSELGNDRLMADLTDQDGRPRFERSDTARLAEVDLRSTPKKAKVYRPTKWDYVRAEKKGDIESLLTDQYRCPRDTDGKCSFDSFTEYRLIFVIEGRREVRPCIPTRDPVVEVSF